MYSTISLQDESYKSYITLDKDKELSNLSRINIFVGPNNSGKSRFMRALFSDKELKFNVHNLKLDLIKESVDKLLEDLYAIIGTDQSGLGLYINGTELDPITMNLNFLQYSSDLDALNNAVRKLMTIDRYYFRHVSTFHSRTIESGIAIINLVAETCFEKLENAGIRNINQEKYKRTNIYIPTLRGLRAINYVNDNELNYHDSFEKSTNNAYFKDKSLDKNTHKIFTGLSLYKDIKNHLLGNSEKRDKIREFEDFLSTTFFDNQAISIIPHNNKNVYVDIGNEKDRPIYELGEGIQALIILTYQLFMYKDEYVNFFFEEPDMFLHPGFQRLFIETLSDERFNKFQYFMTTHSNHFLDMSLDFKETSIYNFSKNTDGGFTISNAKHADKDLLHALGVRNSSVFLSNCTIWVEGITDRIYIRKYLEIYMTQNGIKKYYEDLHYSFVEYGGNNITHWSFLESEDENHANINIDSLCGKLFLITDLDGSKSNSNNKQNRPTKKQKRHSQLEQKLGDNYYCLKCREIENLLMPKTIEETIKEMEGGIENCKEINFSKLYNYAKYKSKGLGEFIFANIPNLQKKYHSESGTITNKVQFAKHAVKFIDNLDYMSLEAQDLAKRIYNFIKDNNSKAS